MRRFIGYCTVGEGHLPSALGLLAVLHLPGCGRIGFESEALRAVPSDAGRHTLPHRDAAAEDRPDTGLTGSNPDRDAAFSVSSDAGNHDAALGEGITDANVDSGDAAPLNPNDAGGDGIARCRFDPDCATGGVGATCLANEDCSAGECCTDALNCRGGMCLISCIAEGDCPSDMHCAHGYCFFICDAVSDCAPGMGCFHMSPPYVCEWG